MQLKPSEFLWQLFLIPFIGFGSFAITQYYIEKIYSDARSDAQDFWSAKHNTYVRSAEMKINDLQSTLLQNYRMAHRKASAKVDKSIPPKIERVSKHQSTTSTER